jgi:repressor LexA
MYNVLCVYMKIKNLNSITSLTLKEKSVLDFLETEILKSGITPSYQEIQNHFQFASINSVQNYLKQLESKGYIRKSQNQKRSLQILQTSAALQKNLQKSSTKARTSANQLLQAQQKFSSSPLFSLPLAGKVAAGLPLERFIHDEYVEVPPSMVRHPDKTYVLRVEGDSMIEDGILDGDLILVEQTSLARNGDIIVAAIENESTVKRFFKRQDNIELKPANSQMKSFFYNPEQVSIQGLVIGLIRQFA